MTAPLIQVLDLTYYYADEATPALNGVSLEVAAGEFVLIAGPSGCGKSTLALALNGIIPTLLGGRIKGQVLINGQEARTAGVHALSTQVGLVFQDPDAQLCNLTVEEEVGFGPANLRRPAAEIFQSIAAALAAVGGAALRPKSIFELSGGEKQRVAIAAVLAMQPPVVIFDEPSANLDPAGAQQVFDLLRRLNREQGLTIIVIEHNVDMVMPYADRLVVMEQGAIRHSGAPRDVLREHGTYLRDTLGLRLPQVTELALRLAEQGRPLEPLPLPLTVAEALAGLRAGGLHIEAPAPPAPLAAAPPIIETEGLSFSYPNGTPAVRKVTLSIARGAVVGLVGENGSGKTTLTALLTGLLRPTAGRGVVAGLELAQASARALVGKVGYVFQYPEHQFVASTVYDEVAYSLKALRLPAEAVTARVEAILQRFGLEALRAKHPFRLSMGQKRRLSVATMLVLDPALLILDEPTTGQDQRHSDQMLAIVQQADAQGTTVILVTHDLELVARYCQRVIVMDKGEVIFQGTREALAEALPSLRTTALVLPPLHELARQLSAPAAAPDIFTVDEFAVALRGPG